MEYKRIGKDIISDVKYGDVKALDGYLVKGVADIVSFCYGMTYTNCKVACINTKFNCTTFRDCVIAGCEYTDFKNCKFIRCQFVDRLSYNDFHGCSFSWCDFGKMRIGCTEFLECKFRKCSVERVKLVDDVHEIRGASSIRFFEGLVPMSCPRKGSYTAYKKCMTEDLSGAAIVVLEIPSSARRSSAFGKKCRADKAKVLAIHPYDENSKKMKGTLTRAVSKYVRHFVYEVGKTVVEVNFDKNRFKECAPGIHHYVKLADAKNHVM